MITRRVITTGSLVRTLTIVVDHTNNELGKICEERIFKEHVEEYEYKFKNSAELLQKDGESATIEWTTVSINIEGLLVY